MNKEKTKEPLESERKRTNGTSLSHISVHHKDTSGESSPDTEEEDEYVDRGRQDQSDLPAEYWQIQKLVKYLKVLP